MGVKFLKCPKCREIVPYEGSWCSECFENYDRMNITERDFIKPLFEKKFVDLSDEKRYMKIVMFSETDGMKVKPRTWKGEYEEGYFIKPIKKCGNVIKVVDEDFGTQYETQYEIGDWYLRSLSKMDVYRGNIPNGNYFEVYCETGTIATLEIWFTNNGDIFMYNPEIKSMEDLKPVEKGRYVREGDIIRYEMRNIKSGETTRDYACVINGKYVSYVYVSEDKYNQIKGDLNKPISITNPVIAPATISEQEFFKNYPCLSCNTRQMWTDKEWKYYAGGEISVYAKCKICGYVAQEIEKPDKIKRIAYHGSSPIQGYRPPAGTVRYLDNPCPHCHAYQVRYAKWKDKRGSIYFWGMLSPKIGAQYICDNCKKMWE